jgi:hypothetical protein
MREHPDGDEPIPSASSVTQNDPDSSLRDTRDEWDRGQRLEDYFTRFIPPRLQNSQTNVVRTAPRPDRTEQSRRYIEIDPQHKYEQQKEMRRRAEEALREIRRREETEGIMRRQKEAEDAARAAMRPLYPPLPVVYTDSSNPTSIPPSHIAVPNPEPVIQSQVPQPQEITPPKATQQVLEVPHPQSSILTVPLTSPPSSPAPLPSPYLSALLTRLSKVFTSWGNRCAATHNLLSSEKSVPQWSMMIRFLFCVDCWIYMMLPLSPRWRLLPVANC